MFAHLQLFIELIKTYLNYGKYSVDSEKQNQRNLNSKKVIPNIFHKYKLAFALLLLVIAIWYCPELTKSYL